MADLDGDRRLDLVVGTAGGGAMFFRQKEDRKN
jgi:hypothetical protein